jgi:selenoprotein W-related protein
LAVDLLKEFEPKITMITLIPSGGGKFEVMLNQELVYSKLETLRHTNPGEVVGLVRHYLADGS